MTRFFMTIPEAVQLVIRSGLAGPGGEVYVLEMGEPVRIMDLAEDMIRFSGLEPGQGHRDRGHRRRGRARSCTRSSSTPTSSREPTPAQKILRAVRAGRRSGLGRATPSSQSGCSSLEGDAAALPPPGGRARRPSARRRSAHVEPVPEQSRGSNPAAARPRSISAAAQCSSLLAFSLQDQVEKYGAYVGIASFFGLAMLSVLYFAQAREVRRLRDWAGRAPERDRELEQRVSAQADEQRRAPAPARRLAAEPATIAAAGAAVAAESGAEAPGPVAVPRPANGRKPGPAAIPMGPRPATAAAAVAAAVSAVAAPAKEEEAKAAEAEPEPETASPAAQPAAEPATAAAAAAKPPRLSSPRQSRRG